MKFEEILGVAHTIPSKIVEMDFSMKLKVTAINFLINKGRMYVLLKYLMNTLHEHRKLLFSREYF